jgi:multicomponent Na+:H+ antiporter subunit E
VRRPGSLLILVLVWVALWEELSWGNVVSGTLVGLAVLALSPPRPRPTSGKLRPIPAIRFLTYFMWKLAESNVIVGWEVVTPRNRINEGIVAVPIRGLSDRLITLVANCISLTPGTLTLEVERSPAVLYVHVLHLDDVAAVRRDVQHLEALAVRAFGSDQAVAALGALGLDTGVGEVSQAAARVAEEPDR